MKQSADVARIMRELQAAASDHDAQFLQRYFKTGPGEYGEGDIFIGVRVPAARRISRRNWHLPLEDIQLLLDSPIHEHRLVGLHIAVIQFNKSDEPQRTKIYEWYLKNLAAGRINNWDLIDTSCSYIMGMYLIDKPIDILQTLAASTQLWERRAAIMATFASTMQGDATKTFTIARLLMHDDADLIHKAVGWMLREAGKRADRQQLIEFLEAHAHEMPRTMLRYSIEKLSPQERSYFMSLKKSRAA